MEEPPFRGLLRFSEQLGPRCIGRESEVAELVEDLRNETVLVRAS